MGFLFIHFVLWSQERHQLENDLRELKKREEERARRAEEERARLEAQLRAVQSKTSSSAAAVCLLFLCVRFVWRVYVRASVCVAVFVALACFCFFSRELIIL